MQGKGLTHFENISNVNIGQETFLALSNHGNALQTLKLALTNDGFLALGCLHGCTGLSALEIAAPSSSAVDLKAIQNDVFLDILTWLKSCHNLRDITFENVLSAADLLTPVLSETVLRVQSLQINAKEGSMYVMKDHQEFHKALGLQSHLRSLTLRAEPDPPSYDAIDHLVGSLCALKELRELNLTRISDYFTDSHVSQLAQYLPKLESLYVGGLGLTDAVWDKLSTLRSLKSVTFSNITSFTTGGMLDFISSLDAGNQGLVLSIDRADFDSALTEEEQTLVRDTLAVKVDGRFAYERTAGMTFGEPPARHMRLIFCDTRSEPA